MALLLKHQTAQEFVARFRAAYRTAERERLIRMATWLLTAIQAGDITDAQCRTAFGVNTTQWTAIKTKMQDWITAQQAVNSAVGE